jgi:predicted branched-subunit amino acid permease
MLQNDPSQDPAEPIPGPNDTHLRWLLRGIGAAFSIPALILMSSFIGFAALAVESGLSMAHAVFMTAVVWALPAKVVLVGAIAAGNGIAAATFAVALSSIRLGPMVVALVPEIRGPRTRRWVLYMLAHFVAVTSWVLAMQEVRSIPRDFRTAWYGGLGASLILLNMMVVAAVYMVADVLPPSFSAALFFLTPLYFLTSLWGSARERAGHVAMVLGLLLGPVMAMVTPDFALLATGLVGGFAAYGFHRYSRRKKGVNP